MEYTDDVERELLKLRYAPGYITHLGENMYMALCPGQFGVSPVYVQVYMEEGACPRFDVTIELDKDTLLYTRKKAEMVIILYSFRVLAEKITRQKKGLDEYCCYKCET